MHGFKISYTFPSGNVISVDYNDGKLTIDGYVIGDKAFAALLAEGVNQEMEKYSSNIKCFRGEEYNNALQRVYSNQFFYPKGKSKWKKRLNF
tara:strand:+ start:166 stop:441 length:276 start_codon:yes stop_codon:yes gene_type:complete